MESALLVTMPVPKVLEKDQKSTRLKKEKPGFQAQSCHYPSKLIFLPVECSQEMIISFPVSTLCAFLYYHLMKIIFLSNNFFLQSSLTVLSEMAMVNISNMW